MTATLTSEEAAGASFVAPDEPATVTVTIRGNASPAKSLTVMLEPAEAGDAGTSAQTEEEVADLVRSICRQMGAGCR